MDLSDIDSIGELIRRARVEAWLSQGELGKRLKVSQQAIGAWELGTIVPSIRSSPEQIASALEVGSDWIDRFKVLALKPVGKKIVNKDPTIELIARFEGTTPSRLLSHLIRQKFQDPTYRQGFVDFCVNDVPVESDAIEDVTSSVIGVVDPSISSGGGGDCADSFMPIIAEGNGFDSYRLKRSVGMDSLSYLLTSR